MSFLDTLAEEEKLVVHAIHHAAKVAAPHVAQAEATLQPLTVAGGSVGKVAVVSDEALGAFSALLSQLDALFGKLDQPAASTPSN